MTVLIADDDLMSRLVLEKSLKGDHVSLLQAENGMEAVELVENNPEINLVLMDIQMPLMDGFEATRRIKHLRPEVIVIAQTAFVSKDYQVNAKAAGCDGFITKPVNKSELLGLMQMLLDR
jgi:hypothetical protein